MKKLLSLSMAAMLAATALTGCSNTADNTSTGATSSANSGGSAEVSESAEKFIIGGLGPVTGGAASYGLSVKQGAEIAIKEINEAGGVKIGNTTYEFVLEFADDEADPDKAIPAYNSLMDKGIHVLMGAVTSDASIAISDLTNEDGILQITPSGSAIDCIKYSNQFRLCFTDPLQGVTLADYIADELNLTKVAVIYNNSNEYSTGVKDAFLKQAEVKGLEIVAEEAFVKGDIEYSTQLTSIKSTEAEVIVAPIYYEEASYILQQASDLDITIPFIGSDGWDGILNQLTDVSDAEGAIFLSPFLASDESAKDFVAAYEAAYGVTPDQFAANGYDTIHVFKLAMEDAGSINSEALIASMTNVKLQGLTGDITFNENGEPNKGAKFVLIRDGQYTSAN